MRFFENETEAREAIANIIKPIYPNAHLFIAERNTQNIGLRDVTFVARVKKNDEKTNELVNVFFNYQVNYSEKLSWVGTKIDFLNDEETEYILIKAVIENGN